MLKKWLNIVKKKQTDEHDNEEKVLKEYEDEIETEAKINKEIETAIKGVTEIVESKKEDVDIEELRIKNEVECGSAEEIKEESEIENNNFNELENETEAEKSEEAEVKADKTDESHELENNIELIEEKRNEKVFEIAETLRENDNHDADFIKEVKIKRAKSIKAINIYTNENVEFKTHADCSRKLKVPLSYIKENILYGYTDYFGDAINYIGEQLGLMEYSDKNDKYLDNGKNPFETYKQLNDRIFSPKVSEEKRGYILGSSTIEPISMTYSFECLDSEFDDYYHKYKEIIKRTGKKKVELVKKNGDLLEVFKSVEECANYLKIDKTKIQEMLKCGDTKVDRNYIRYSFRKI